MPDNEQQTEQTGRAAKINNLITALVNKFEEKSNKVTSAIGWGQTLSDDKYPSEKLVKQSLDNKLDTSAKITSWSAEADSTKVPAETLVKTELDAKELASNKVSAWSNEVSNTKYPTEKLVKDELDNKISKSNTVGLVKNDGTIDTTTYLSSHQSLTDIGGQIAVTKQTTAESGYAHTYVISQGGTDLSTKINIPKDYLVKSGEVKTVAASDLSTLGSGFTTGDKYIDFVVNTKGNDGTDEHIYINVKDLVEDTTYDADNTTLQLSNGVFSIKNTGVDTAQIKDSAVATAKIADKAVTTAKIADGAVGATQLSSTFVDGLWGQDETDSEIESYIEDLTTALSN